MVLRPQNGTMANVGASARLWPRETKDGSRRSSDAMRYSEIPNNFSYDSFFESRGSQHRIMDSDEEEEIGCSGVKNIAMPMCAQGTSPPTSMYRKVIPDSNWDTSDGLKNLTKTAYSYGYVGFDRTLPRAQSMKATSTYTKIQTESPIIDILRVPPEEWAAQITLLDIPIFKAITPEELTSCGWTKKQKLKLSPNVVEMTRRFNHISFWVVREILNRPLPKQRGEMMSHFIRVAKKLNDLNNFHSQFAVVSALQSAPIYRLSKTWACLSKKDRQHYDRMTDFFSDNNNFEELRNHVNSLKLPMIPYLGLFLTDLVYIDMAHPHFGGLESEQRQLKMNNILRVLADYQLSDYSQLPSNPQVRNYLTSVRYIEELQKFVEDDHYKLSLQLEPNTVNASSKDSINECCTSNSSPVRNILVKPPVAFSSQAGHGHQSIRFVPGHRKARSLGTKFRSMSLPRNISRGDTNTPHIERFCIFKAPSYVTPESMRSDSLTSLGYHDPGCPSASGSHGSRHLLDDSQMDTPVTSNLMRTWSEISSDSDDVGVDLTNNDCGVQGPLRRKTVVKGGKKPTVSSWKRYWVQLWGGALVYYHARSMTSRGLDRTDFKNTPCKLQHLETESGKLKILSPLENPNDTDSFKISDPTEENVYKFKAPSKSAARSWISSLLQSLSEIQHVHPENLITFE